MALVIGNGAYANVPSLTNPLHDAADMCAALRRVGFKTLCYTNVPDRAEFDAHVTEYVEQLGPRSVGVFYYSGHGVQAHGANFMIPTEVQLASATQDPLQVLYGLDTVFARLRQKPAQLQLVILDACRTDLFAATQATGRGAAGASTEPSLVRALATLAQASNGLARITDAPPATMVLYATASKDAAFDGEGRNGPLTKYILRHIGARGLPLEEFIKRVTSDVENETARDYDKRQTPFIYGSFTGSFCFAGCPGESAVPPVF
ncbi:MAG TPA: caspase family protein [Steroidobacteraceae bacterium]|nr:caspase family protein [Steroidobacteraceae bacterium]